MAGMTTSQQDLRHQPDGVLATDAKQLPLVTMLQDLIMCQGQVRVDGMSMAQIEKIHGWSPYITLLCLVTLHKFQELQYESRRHHTWPLASHRT